MQNAEIQKAGHANALPPRALVGVAASILILFGAIFWTLHIGKSTNLLDHEYSHITDDIASTQKRISVLETRLAT